MIQVDTLKRVSEIEPHRNVEQPKDVSSGLSMTILTSIFLLVLVSYFKYHIEKKNSERDYWQFALELPIDLGSTIIAILLSYYYLVSAVQIVFIATLAELLFMVIATTLRNKADDMLTESDQTIPRKKIFLFLLGDIVLVCLPAIFIFVNLYN